MKAAGVVGSVGTADTSRQPPRLQRGGRIAGWAALAGLGGIAVARLTGNESTRWLIGVQGVARWLLLPAHIFAAIFLHLREPRLTLVATALAGYQIGLCESSHGRASGDHTSAEAVPIRLVSANLLLNNPCVLALGRDLLALQPTLVTIQELTPDHVDALRRSGLLRALPYVVLDPRPGFHGSAVLSRWPLRECAVLDLAGTPMASAVVQTPAGPLKVVSVHTLNPGAPGNLRAWQRQLDHLSRLVADSDIPVVLAGDYNGTADHRSFRRMLGPHLRDAFSVAGRGSGASWPSWHPPMVPLMRLDHALVTPEVLVLAATDRGSPGSDHRQLVVDLALAAGERSGE